MDKYFIERWHAMLDSCLTEREARLLAQRYQVEEGRINTLQEIADIEGISRERVRQILNKCFRKLVSKADRDITAGNHDSERAALVHHLRSIVLSSEDGHVDRLVSYLIEEFGHLPADKNSLALLIRLVYRNRQERDQYTVEAQGVLVSRLENAGQQRSTVRGQSWEKQVQMVVGAAEPKSSSGSPDLNLLSQMSLTELSASGQGTTYGSKMGNDMSYWIGSSKRVSQWGAQLGATVSRPILSVNKMRRNYCF